MRSTRTLLESLESRVLLSVSVISTDFHFETAPHEINFQFDGDASSIGAGDLLLERVSPDGVLSTIPIDASQFSYDSGTHTATFVPDVVRFVDKQVLESGNYRAVLPADGTILDEDSIFDFFFLDADANRDRIVNIADEGILAANWQETGKTFSEGDFNYDGEVTIADLGILGGVWQQQVPPFVVSATSGMAPFAVHVHTLDVLFSASGAVDTLNNGYDWDFGDTKQSSRYNELRGWNAAHVYDENGTYTITLTRTDDGGPEVLGTAKIAVSEDTRNEIFVSESEGDDSNDGTSEANAVRTLAKAHALLQSSGSDTAVLFRRGDVFEFDFNFSIMSENILIGAYGSGGSPVLMSTMPLPQEPADPNEHWMINIDASSQNVTVEGITFDSIHGVGQNDPAPKIPPIAVEANGTVITVRDAEFRNVNYAVNNRIIEGVRGVLLKDSSAPVISGLRSYLFWGDGGQQSELEDVVLLGNSTVNSTQERPVRFTSYDRVLMAHNTLHDTKRGAEAHQAKGPLWAMAGNHLFTLDNEFVGGPVNIGPISGINQGQRVGDNAERTVNVYLGDSVIDHDLIFRHGVINALVEQNQFLGDRAKIGIEGWSEEYQRESSNIQILGNVFDHGSSTLSNHVLSLQPPSNESTFGGEWDHYTHFRWMHTPVVTFEGNVYYRTGTADVIHFVRIMSNPNISRALASEALVSRFNEWPSFDDVPYNRPFRIGQGLTDLTRDEWLSYYPDDIISA